MPHAIEDSLRSYIPDVPNTQCTNAVNALVHNKVGYNEDASDMCADAMP